MEGTKKKKSIFKRWWFWVIAVVVVGFIWLWNSTGDGTQTSNTKPTADTKAPAADTAKPVETPPVKEEPKDESIVAGMYKVGTDIKAGEYVVVGDGAYVELSKDSAGTLDSVIANENVQNRTIFTIKDGQYFQVTNGKIYPISKAPKVEPVDGKLPAGMYKVGVDIKAGEYKVQSDADGYIEVTKNSSHVLESVVSNDNFSGEKYITVKKGQYLTVYNGSIIAK